MKKLKIVLWALFIICIASEAIAVGQQISQISQIPQIPQIPQTFSTPISVIIEIVLTGILGALGWAGRKLYNNIESNQIKHESFMEKLNDKIDKSILTLTERIAKVEQKSDDCKSCNS